MEQQLGLSGLDCRSGKHATCKKLLTKMDVLVPLIMLDELIEPYFCHSMALLITELVFQMLPLVHRQSPMGIATVVANSSTFSSLN